jgi:DNA-binding GntR family transcriptional regulator
MLRAEDDSDTNVLVRLNREFHWAIFDSSPETFVCDRVRQLWNISEAYRATYIAVRSDRERMHEHHAEMIQAIEQHDGEWLTKIHDLHRSDSEVVVTRLLRPQAVRTA